MTAPMNSGVNVTHLDPGRHAWRSKANEGGERNPFKRTDPTCAARAGRPRENSSGVGRHTIRRLQRMGDHLQRSTRHRRPANGEGWGMTKIFLESVDPSA